MLKYQNTSEIVNDFIVNEHFPKLKKYFKRNALIYRYIYASLFPKYFCRVDNYGVRGKLAFDIAYGNYKNQQENVHFICETSIKQEVVETSEVVEMCPPHPPSSTSTPEAEKKEYKPKKRKAKCKCDIVAKIELKKKKREEKKAKLLCDLKMNDFHMERINSKK